MKLRMKATILSFLTLAISVSMTTGSRILFISAISAKSHKGFFSHVANSLADRGHHVTMVSSYKPSKTRENVREIVLEGIDILSILPNLFKGSNAGGVKALVLTTPALCVEALSRKEIQELLKEEFDLGIIFMFLNDCFYSLFHKLKIPYIQIYSAGLYSSVAYLAGNPLFSSFINNPMVHVHHPLTFPQRLINVVADIMFISIMKDDAVPRMDYLCRQRGLCPDDMPNLVIMRQNGSLLFINSIRSIETPPRPVVPSVIYCGGIHLKNAGPLPQDLEEWVSEAGDEGFIYLSLGTAVTPSSMPEEHRKILIKVFSSLKQRVLWKWDKETMDDLPPNVRLSKWFPQQDILGHSRLRVFMTHGGALSTQESIYHKKPVIGLPVYADQQTNMVEVEKQGWGRVIIWDEMTEESLKETILSVMNDESLQKEVERRSTLMQDVPQDPHDIVNYWVNYVIRHKGAYHLQSPILSMSWYQVYNVDVWITIILIILFVFFIFWKILKCLFRCCCGFRSKSKTD